MKKGITLLFLTLIVLASNVKSSTATHIMGGAIEWESLGGDSFIVDLTLYRDCNGINVGTLQYVIANYDTNYIRIPVQLISNDDITLLCDGEYSRCDTSTSFKYGVQRIVYSGTLNLKSLYNANACKVDFNWSSCCRSNSITTGAANGNLYINAQMNLCVNRYGSSPKWTKSPKNLLCLGQSEIIKFGTKPKSTTDSVYYTLDSPLVSNSLGTTYSSSYAFNKPFYFLGFPKTWSPAPRGFYLDSTNGDISFRPMKSETSILKLKASIYHNDSLYGFTTRELQTTVRKCQNSYAPRITGINGGYSGAAFSVDACPGDTVSFQISSNTGSGDTAWLSVTSNRLPASATISRSGKKYSVDTLFVQWVPSVTDVSNFPYYLVVSAKNNACPINRTSARVFSIRVNPPKLEFQNEYSTLNTCGLYAIKTREIDSNAYQDLSWYIDNKLVSKADSFSYEFKTPGKHIIKLKHDGTCFDTTIIDTIEVKVANDFSFGINRNKFTFCGNDSVQVNALILGGTAPYKHSWEIGSNLPYSGPLDADTIELFIDNVEHRNTVAISLKIEDKNGCIDSQFAVIYTRYTTKSNSYRDFTYCEGADSFIQLNKSVSGPAIGSNNKVSIKDLAPGENIYYADFKRTGYCLRDTFSIFIKAKPNVNAGENRNACYTTEELKLKGTPSGGRWQGNTVSGSSFFPTKAKVGTHVLKYKYTNNQGCSAEDEVRIFVTDEKEKIKFGKAPIACEGDSFAIAKASPKGGFWQAKSFISYKDSVQFPIINLPKGEYFLKYIINDSVRCSSEDSVLLTIVNTPVASIGFEYSDSVVYHTEEFTATFTGIKRQIDSYSFYVQDSLMQSGRKRKFTHKIDESGEYAIGLIVTDTVNFCPSERANAVLYVEHNTSTPNIEPSNIQLFPNPFTNQITVKTAEKNGLIKVYDLDGKELLTENINSVETTLNLNVYAKGVYKIEVLTPSGSYTKLIVKN